MAVKKDAKSKGAGGEQPAAEEARLATPAEIEATRIRIGHMFQLYTGDALMMQVREVALRLAAEGRLHD